MKEGKIITQNEDNFHVGERPYAPILIVVPPSVVDNWAREFKVWGHFSVQVCTSGTDIVHALRRVQTGSDDIMLSGLALFRANYEHFLDIKWKLVVVDEFHEYKNWTTKAYQALDTLRNASLCPIVGMTGTPMPNELKVS